MLRPSLLLSLAVAAAVDLIPCQTWSEQGDAGQTLDRAQVVTTVGTVSSITGHISADADVFMIEVVDPASFSATSTTGFDGQMWLFDADGLPVASNDDSGFVVSPALTAGCVKLPGRYYLAMSPYNYDARSLAGLQWSGLLLATAPANGPGRHEALADWVGTTALVGNYTINLTGAVGVTRHAVLPGTHNLSESQLQAAGIGSTGWWRSNGGHFQILYEASNFNAAGAYGVIDLERIMFRAEDGQAHQGGMHFPGVVVRVGATSLTVATMSDDFSANLSPTTTTLLSYSPPLSVPVLPSLGSLPNNYNIVIDVDDWGPPTLDLDLAGPQPNLLVDVYFPVPVQLADPSIPMVKMQDSSGVANQVFGRGLTTANTSATTGTLSDSPLVMGVDFNANVGMRKPIPARTEYYGAACGGSPSAFYQAFNNGQTFDLTGLRLVPDNVAGPTKYSVQRIDIAPDVSKVNPQPDSIADDATVPHALGFAFAMPNAIITAIRPSTNGFVWLDGTTADSDLSPSIGELLSHASPSGRLAPFWTDLHCGRNITTHANSGLHVRTDTSGGVGNAVCYVTWLNVGSYQTTTSGALTHTFQCVLRQATGEIEFRYGTMPRRCALGSSGYAVLTGFAPNRGVDPNLVDPQSRDLSLEVPFSTMVEGMFSNMGLDSVSTPVADAPAYGARMFPGQTVKWNVNSIPPGSLLGVQLIDIQSSRPGAFVPTITAPGCVLSTSQFASLHEVNLLPGNSVLGSNGLTVPASIDFAGARICAQYVVLGGLFGAPDLITVASNSIEHTIGRR